MWLAKFLVISFIFLKGCLVTWQSQSDPLRETLRNEIIIVQKNQAELTAQLKKLQTDVKVLDEKISTLNTRLTLLAQKVDDLQLTLLSKIDSFYQRISGISDVILSPSETYRIARFNYLKGNFSLAITHFKMFLEKNPSAELAPEVQYLLADSYYAKAKSKLADHPHYAKDKLETAITEFSNLLTKYPNSEFVRASMLKQAQCLIQLNRLDEAKEVLKKLINDHPETIEAIRAKDELKSIETLQQR